ncbi:MAG TPA: TolC family protein [Candidatus Acidoferrales bacterium]|nr:TolC family protein [Candidatus Acidoferrales bacterium]
MNATKKLILICLAFAAVNGCAMQRYRRAPISPSETATHLESRNLEDAGLRVFLEKNLKHPISSWPLKSWDLRSLTLAAFYFNPEMEIARQQAGVAEAAVITAGARPNPTLSVKPGVPSPYLFGLDFAIPIQTAGKRGYQIVEAKNLSEAARFGLTNTAWQVRSAVRTALVEYLVAVRNEGQMRSQESVLSDRVQLLQKRLAVGEISRPELDLARIDLANARLGDLNAGTQISQDRSLLAGAIGIPVSALDGVEFSWPNFDSPPDPDSLSVRTIQREAVLNRLDVRQALATYTAAEASLQLEIARQYPDIQIGPGYTYEEGNSFFTLGLSTMLPVFNRNQGPIAEAEARRKEAAAQFLATQARVIVESQTAFARYSGAWKELTEAERVLKLHGGKVQLAQQTFKAGESGPLPVNSELLGSAVAASAKLAALSRTQAALGSLEDPVERPLEPGDILPLSPESPALKGQAKEKKR